MNQLREAWTNYAKNMKGRVEIVIVTTREALGEFRAEFDGKQLNLYGNSGNSHMSLREI